MNSDKQPGEELSRPMTIVGLILGYGLIALNLWVFTLVY